MVMRRSFLVLPVIAFNLVFFVFPLGLVILMSVHDAKFADALPNAAAALSRWDGEALPGEDVQATMVADLRAAYRARTLSGAAQRLNYELPGFNSLLINTGRKVETLAPPYREALVALDPRWGDIDYWRVAASASSPYTAFFLLSSLDLKRQPDGTIERAPEDKRIYLDTLARTLWISVVVTFICLLAGYPMAYLIAALRGGRRAFLLGCVMVPFWMSLLVRTSAWVVLLQTRGLVNDTLRALGIIAEPLELIYNRPGVYVAMAHILLPFMILPIYSVMQGVRADQMRAALSLGARPTAAFLGVYLPQTLPGVAAGTLLVFIMSIGFYVTPALVGAGSDQMLSYLIAQFTTQNANWGMASSLALLLMLTVAATFVIVERLTGMGKPSFVRA